MERSKLEGFIQNWVKNHPEGEYMTHLSIYPFAGKDAWRIELQCGHRSATGHIGTQLDDYGVSGAAVYRLMDRLSYSLVGGAMQPNSENRSINREFDAIRGWIRGWRSQFPEFAYRVFLRHDYERLPDLDTWRVIMKGNGKSVTRDHVACDFECVNAALDEIFANLNKSAVSP